MALIKNIFVFIFLILFSFSCKKDNNVEPSQAIEKPVLQLLAIHSDEVEIGWADLDGANAYEVDVALDEEFNQILPDYNAFRVTNSEITIQNLNMVTTYFIRARTVSADEAISANSNVIEVVTAASTPCDDPSKFVFLEEGGVVKAEFENAEFGNGWELKVDNNKATGRGYMVWELSDYFSTPSNDLATYDLKISTPGTYKFVWYSAVTQGNSGTEHNDTWLRFPDAEDFYAKKNNEIVYPKGTGKTPNPEGASADGWFKIYRSGNDLDFKWQARTSDRDPHEIYVTFSNAKTYQMQISARSNGHGVDKFVLFLESLNETTITSTAPFSEIICM